MLPVVPEDGLEQAVFALAEEEAPLHAVFSAVRYSDRYSENT